MSILGNRGAHCAKIFAASVSAVLLNSGIAFSQDGLAFNNWESPHVYPIDVTPDFDTLLAVNTADHRLEVFDIIGGMPEARNSIPVGLDPVTVRARTNDEVWVVNHISDSISIVDLNLGVVTRTLQTEDEPADVVFANGRAFVTCSQVNKILVFDLSDLSAAPQEIEVLGEDPRALAVSPDGRRVYAAIFESGNATTIIPGGRSRSPDGTESALGPYGGVTPPPNDGAAFNPPMNPDNPTPPRTGMIVRKNATGQWMDDNNGDWTSFISGENADLAYRVPGWDMPDNDVVIIDTTSLAVTYQPTLMNMVMGIDVNPRNNRVTVVGTEARNSLRFEPNLRSHFVIPRFADFAANGGGVRLRNLNSLSRSVETIPLAQRARSVGDPRTITWGPNGIGGYVTGMGSNNVLFVNRNGTRRFNNVIQVGQGPTGLVYAPGTGSVFVLNRFDASISVIRGRRGGSEVAQVPFFDPTPDVIRAGRPFLYDTHIGSGLGQVACASCHVDARMDRLAWDLGNPAGEMLEVNGVRWHPMKGPMRTTALIGLTNAPSLHFRGDKDDLTGFASTFANLQGLDEPATEEQMLMLDAFLSTIQTPPNPYRNLDNSRPTEVRIPGVDDRVGNPLAINNSCNRCHIPTQAGRDGRLRLSSGNMPGGASGVQPAISPSLRSMHEIFGLDYSEANASTAGFGFIPDGSFDLETQNTLQNNNAVAFMMTYNGDLPGDTHAAVGKQVTFGSVTNVEDEFLLNDLMALADTGVIGMIAKGLVNGALTGFTYDPTSSSYASTSGQTVTHAELVALAGPQNPITFTAVPFEARVRMGIDRDSNGVFNASDF